jgi:hypothetical protein
MGQPRFYTLPPACVLVFCLHRHPLPPARVLCFIRRTSVLSAYCMLDTALRALTDPASLSKDASVSNEHLQEITREAASLPLPLAAGFWVCGCCCCCGLRCPVFCLINTLPPACVFVFCLHRHSLPPARVLCLVPFPGLPLPHGKKMRPCCVFRSASEVSKTPQKIRSRTQVLQKRHAARTPWYYFFL